MELNVDDIVKDFADLELSNSREQKLNELRKESKFCDLTLKINDKDLFKVHKNIIATSCPYFTGLFNGDWKETREDVISLDYEIQPECFEIILVYMYTGKLGISNISYVNSLILHQGALFFNLLKLKQIMSKILVKFITTETLLNLWRHGVKFLDNELASKCIDIISENPTSFFQHNLTKLIFNELNILYKDKKLNCSEDIIYEYLIQWVKADFVCREIYLKDLLNLVDFSKLSGEFIQSKILKDKTLYKNEDYIAKIMGELSLRFQITPNNTENMTKKLNIILISNTGVFKIDLDRRICLRVLKHEIKRTEFTVTKCGSNILIAGGLSNLGPTNLCEYYSIDLNLIRQFTPMLEKRCYHKILAFNNKIYAFGGNVCKDTTMEIFDINTGEWTVGPKMPRTRRDFMIIRNDDKIKLFGGFCDGDSVLPIDTYDIEKNKWESSKCGYSFPSTTKRIMLTGTTLLFDSSGFRTSDDYDNPHCFYNKQNYFTDEYTDLYLYPFDVMKIHDEILIFGRKNDKGMYSAILDIKSEKLKEINIDISQCDDIGEEEFHLINVND